MFSGEEVICTLLAHCPGPLLPTAGSRNVFDSMKAETVLWPLTLCTASPKGGGGDGSQDFSCELFLTQEGSEWGGVPVGAMGFLVENESERAESGRSRKRGDWTGGTRWAAVSGKTPRKLSSEMAAGAVDRPVCILPSSGPLGLKPAVMTWDTGFLAGAAGSCRCSCGQCPSRERRAVLRCSAPARGCAVKLRVRTRPHFQCS